ncbi:MAG: serine hydrolase [Planctomycetes bacterium]|nr:serine hydrolase [Planctomycetota bacterium]
MRANSPASVGCGRPHRERLSRSAPGRILLVVLSLSAGLRADDALVERLKTAIASEMEARKVPGVSAALIRAGEIAWSGGFGKADAATGAPVDERTLFPAASCSKPVAALAAMLLAERGTLDLDAPIEEVLKTWTPPCRPFFGPVTLRLILAHRAGLSIHGVPGYDKDDPEARTCREELTHSLEFLDEPGTGFRYSGGGFMILQVALEDVTGKTFNTLMEEEILRPLGMEASTFEPFRPPYEDHMACGHYADGRGVAWRVTPGLAAAWLHTTPSDLARFLIAVYRASRLGETNVIRPRTARTMITPTGAAEGRYGAYTSLAFFISDTPLGRVVFHRGSNRGYRCGMWIFLATGDGLVVMTNSENGTDLCSAVHDAVFPAARGADPEELVDFGSGFDPAAVEARDAKVALVGGGEGRRLRVETGTSVAYPGITIPAPKEVWDLSGRVWISLEVSNPGDAEALVSLRVDNAGADGSRNCETGSIRLAPGRSGTIDIPLSKKAYPRGAIAFIGMRGNPPVTPDLDPSKVTQVLVFVSHPKRAHVFEIVGLRAGGAAAPSTEPADPKRFFPMIDPFGQYRYRDWPGKVHGEADLAARRAAEERDIAACPGPGDRDAYGGWAKGPAREATGFFRVEKIDGVWWLIDPEGRLFWSHGIDCVRGGNATPITDREGYFEDLPAADSPLAAFYGRGNWAPHGYYQGKGAYRTYDFARANLLRKYGESWPDASADLAHRRLRSWGMNTIANWSDGAVYMRRRTPYTATVSPSSRRLEGSEGYWGKFPDVFDAGFRQSLRAAFAREKGRTAGDPWCIGFFVHNEIAWGDEWSLAVAALKSPADQPAKRAFIEDLKAKYGTIEKLNDAWGAKHASWDALLASTEAPDRGRARDDLGDFYTRTAETYFRTIREELKEAAPQQLYLGCRFAWVNDRAARAGAKYCDVVSYNRYEYSVESLRLPEGCDKPVVIGEFHFGALDRGMFHTGLRRARDQRHRADLYAAYVRGALENPLIVGTHWFQYQDQATTGRGDGENYQIGFLDICDTPYPEIVAAARHVGARMYEIRSEARSR